MMGVVLIFIAIAFYDNSLNQVDSQLLRVEDSLKEFFIDR